ALGTYYLSKSRMPVFLYTLPPILSNTLIIPFVLKFAYGFDDGILFFFATVGAGEIISCGILGTMLYYSLHRHKQHLFK
ncbi:MAG: QueT transporter family protein, partial [Bacteroidales bacterium]|nr:QueT transporter family protein [Bacteroidales bacterium]